MDQYIIPANTKKSQLIFGLFRMIDLIIFVTGAFLTVMLMFIFKGETVQELFIKLAPVTICGLLVMPVPYYHNVMEFTRDAIKYYTRQNYYLWRGWCASNGNIGNDEQEVKN